ncbi:MAG: TlyA family RNA methyltransferase [Thermodesulfovibrionales bacterium]|nr:TlyA family RNA methyltransferase [Thermodesulfovibrionales bacterium]
MKQRLDKVLVKRGFASSRETAQRLIQEGKVEIDGLIDLKPSTMVDIDVNISRVEDLKYVSRGGIKLEAAINRFGIDVENKIAMDVGASTGGFSDCLLQNGVKKVYAVDVGYGQLAWKIRQDSRVVVLERLNARYISQENIPEPVEICVIDVSFISLKKIIPAIIPLLVTGGEVIALFKPQFEVGRQDVGKGGIVRDEFKRVNALHDMCEVFEGFGLNVIDTMTSPIKGHDGNVEYFIYAKKV